MFCLQASFPWNKPLSESFLSQSVKSMNGFGSETRALCQSDSNIPRTCGQSPSKKRHRWKAKLQIRYQRSLPVKIRRRPERENPFERPTRRSYRSPEKKANTAETGDALVPRIDCYQALELEFIDNGDETSGGEDCAGMGDSENQKSENSCLQNKTSINNFKTIGSAGEGCGVVKGVRENGPGGGEEGGAQSLLHLRSDFNRKNESSSDTNLFESSHKGLKRQKTNSGTPFLSLCSLFSLSKAGEDRRNASALFRDNVLTANFSCCSLISRGPDIPPGEQPVNSDAVINESPKPENRALFPDVLPAVKGGRPRPFRTCPFPDSSPSVDSSFDNMAPIASPEVTSAGGSVLSSSKSMDSVTGCEDSFREGGHASGFGPPLVPRLKLLHEGDAHVCFLGHTRTIFRKVLSSKLLRKWESHHVYLTDDCLCSKTPTGLFESPIPYSNLDEVCVVGRWDYRNRFCIRLVMADGSLLMQTSNSLVRDQWLSSILWKKNMHKYKSILRMSTRPDVILKEIKALVFSSLNSPLQDECIRSVPIEIISDALIEEELWKDRQRAEELIVALAPLLEDSTPSAEMFRFFSSHCLSHPRSPVVVDVFTSVVHRILKRTVDFGKTPLMRRFVADYFKALYTQNDGEEAIRKSIASVHGISFGCPHPRVLPNLVAVNLAAVFSHFEQRKTLLTESTNETNCNEALQLLDKQLECFITVFLAISEYEDWRCGLAQLLQPIPFPDDALSHHGFMKGFSPVIREIGTDPRCEVHGSVLGIRENKEGWLSVFCPSSLVCKDEGVLWCEMLKTLFHCCCKRKSFLQKMIKHLGALLLVALRGHAVAQEMLCLMLEWRLIHEEDQKMQVVTTLQSNESGRLKYGELCKRQEHLRELQKEGGPKKLTLPSRSTDADVARLLSCGSFGNLECLSLAFTHVTSACAHQLIMLPALRYLNLWATQFGDAGLVIIAEHLDKLQVLNLCETPVSDKGIAAIAAMRNLKKLNLNSTKLSPQTLDTLKLKLPTLQELDVRYTDAW